MSWLLIVVSVCVSACAKRVEGAFRSDSLYTATDRTIIPGGFDQHYDGVRGAHPGHNYEALTFDNKRNPDPFQNKGKAYSNEGQGFSENEVRSTANSRALRYTIPRINGVAAVQKQYPDDLRTNYYQEGKNIDTMSMIAPTDGKKYKNVGLGNKHEDFRYVEPRENAQFMNRRPPKPYGKSQSFDAGLGEDVWKSGKTSNMYGDLFDIGNTDKRDAAVGSRRKYGAHDFNGYYHNQNLALKRRQAEAEISRLARLGLPGSRRSTREDVYRDDLW